MTPDELLAQIQADAKAWADQHEYVSKHSGEGFCSDGLTHEALQPGVQCQLCGAQT